MMLLAQGSQAEDGQSPAGRHGPPAQAERQQCPACGGLTPGAEQQELKALGASPACSGYCRCLPDPNGCHVRYLSPVGAHAQPPGPAAGPVARRLWLSGHQGIEAGGIREPPLPLSLPVTLQAAGACSYVSLVAGSCAERTCGCGRWLLAAGPDSTADRLCCDCTAQVRGPLQGCSSALGANEHSAASCCSAQTPAAHAGPVMQHCIYKATTAVRHTQVRSATDSCQ